MISARVEHEDGTVTNYTHLRSEREYSFNKQTQASIWVPRPEVKNNPITENKDEVYLEDGSTDIFGGVLSDTDRKGISTELIVDSFEQYAREAEPCPSRYKFTDVSDKVMVEDAIDDVDRLYKGDIYSVKDSDLTFEFNHASPARRIRSIRDATNGEIIYRADKTVDYVAALGSDKSGVTLSPSNQNIEKFNLIKNSGDNMFTHLRMLGAGSSDSQTVVDVAAPSYSEGDRKIWTSYANKSVDNSDTLRSQGEELIDEMQNQHIEIKVTARDVDMDIGDTYHVEYPEENIDLNLRVVELIKSISEEGRAYKATLSNRNLSRQKRGDKVYQDVERYNREQPGETLDVYDDTTIAPQEQGNIIYVTGEDPNYPEGIYYHNGSSYTTKFRGDIESNRIAANNSFVIPVGEDMHDIMVLPTGTDAFETEE